MKLSNYYRPNDKARIVHQLQLKNWPTDQTVPSSRNAVLRLVNLINKSRSEQDTPTRVLGEFIKANFDSQSGFMSRLSVPINNSIIFSPLCCRCWTIGYICRMFLCPWTNVSNWWDWYLWQCTPAEKCPPTTGWNAWTVSFHLWGGDWSRATLIYFFCFFL